MVETAGIEPASEKRAVRAYYSAYPVDLISAFALPMPAWIASAQSLLCHP